MQKQKIGVIAAILLGAAIVVAGIVTVVHLFSNKTESYRSILVYELEGSAEIEREGTGSIKAVENLYLQSGDRIRLAVGSYMRLKLDDDKYIMVEEDSVFRIEATGSKEDSETSIYLEQGAITNEIQNRLSEGSSYEVSTPNSVMAVRGTIFRVEVYFDENGDVYTKLSVFEGNVSVSLVYPDGTRDDEVQVEAGKEIIIHSDEKITEYLGGPSDIDYENFSLETLYILRDLMEGGASLEGITLEELEVLIQKLETGENPEPEKNPTEEPATEKKVHTVTFLYEGKVIGTQEVEDGQFIQQPKLKPAAEGAWDFDFSKAVTENLEIEWK